MNEMVKTLILWLVIALVLMSVFSNFGPAHQQARKLHYSQFLDKLEGKEIGQITIDNINSTVYFATRSGESYYTDVPAEIELQTIQEWANHGVTIDAKPREQQSLLLQIFISWFPIILFIGVWIFFMRQMQGGGGGRGAMSFGRSRARLLGEDQVKVTFADVAGVEEAKEEVEELVDFLREPGKFLDLGGKIPRGVLMVGRPGTGKTLLAKAIAGEAKVPFFTISGSDFVEMFVGVGASRVRDMFEQAKKHAPCIIFIDEIDAVGRHRGSGMGGGHDEREQTLNQLLVEMDGFEGNEGIIVIAATNRPDVLDAALLRPGRFDRQVVVPLPDIRGREQILKVHMRKVPLAEDIEPRVIARGTPGFSGADLANLVNEAALFAARNNKRTVAMIEFEKAKDKIIMGAERRTMVMSEDEKKNTAYHESGHAIVGLTLKHCDPVHKVTIIPRGRALGVTMTLPERDRFSESLIEIESKLSMLFGGRIAEEMIFGKENVTTGASDDINRATKMCRAMVTRYGLSDRMGPLAYEFDDGGESYVGNQGKVKEISEQTSQAIDQEVRRIIDKTYKQAKDILEKNINILHAMSEALLKYETIDAKQIKDIMDGRDPEPPADWEIREKDNDQNGNQTSKSKDSSDDATDLESSPVAN